MKGGELVLKTDGLGRVKTPAARRAVNDNYNSPLATVVIPHSA